MYNWKLITIIVILITMGISATDIYIPSFLAIEEALNTDSHWVQFTITAYLFSFAYSQMVCGPYSDIIGRYKIIKFGLSLSLFSTFICMISSNINIFILGRFIQGIGMGAISVSARAMIADSYQGKDIAKVGSIVGALMPVMIAVSPVIGGIIQEYRGWREVFFFFSICIISVFIIILYHLDETNKYLKHNFAKSVTSARVYDMLRLDPPLAQNALITFEAV